MFKILGVDPGSNCTGYGVISREGHGLFNLTDFRIWLERRYEPVFQSQDADGLRSYTLHIRR